MRRIAHAPGVLVAFSFFFALPQPARASRILPSPVTVPQALRERLRSFEPSSCVYLRDERKYLVASDETDAYDSPWLFLMDEQGVVDENPIVIPGVKKMTDIESISRPVEDDGSIYILSSQSRNKKKHVKRERDLFVKARFRSGTLETIASVELRPLLLNALSRTRDPVLGKLQSQFDRELDIESHFVKGGNLYVGLKTPQPDPSHALILNLGPVDDLLAERASDPNVWKTLDLDSGDGRTNLLTDMAWNGDELLLTTSTDKHRFGHLWSLKGRLTHLMGFPDLRPEGVAVRDQGLFILFDQGKEQDGLFLNASPD